jgi:hypothetical protein
MFQIWAVTTRAHLPEINIGPNTIETTVIVDMIAFFKAWTISVFAILTEKARCGSSPD